MGILRSRVCVCGGGNIAHAVAAVVSQKDDVAVFTRQPNRWKENLSFAIGDDPSLHFATVRASCELQVVAEADYVFIAVPRFATRSMLEKIDASLHAGQTIFFLPAPAGMEEIVARYEKRGLSIAGFQRVPHVARIKEYGKTVWVGDVRKTTRMAFSSSGSVALITEYIEDRFGSKVERLSSFLSFTFSNSNPLLHPSRLVPLLKGGNNGVYHDCPYFYAQWTDEASNLYIKADSEMYQAFQHYSAESAACDYESALAHYESTTPEQMTAKIKSIESLKPILAPWNQSPDGLWRPNFESRYFTEDIPYGTKIIQRYAHKEGLSVPTIDFLVSFIAERMKKGE